MIDSIDSELAALLKNYADIRLAILFGSLAEGTAGFESDIDLAVLATGPLNTTVKMALMEDISNRFGRPVDLIDLHGAGEPLLGEVFKGRRIFGSDTTYAQLLVRHLLDAADFLPIRERILKERRDAWIR